MNKPKPNEVLFMHPITNEFWHLPLVPRGNQDTEMVRKIKMSGIGTFPPKEVQNDWTRSHHEVNSSYTQSDTTGGGQIYEVDEAVDGSRFWFATADTQYMRQVVLPRLAHDVEGLTGPIICLGDYGSTFIVSANQDLYTIAADGTATDLNKTLAAAPKEREGIAFKGTHTTLTFYIAVEGGYQTWDGTTLSALITTCKPVDWAEWDNKLFGIQADGKLMESPDGQSGTWTSPVIIDARYTPTHLVDFFDKQDEPCLHIITRSAVFAVDRANSKALKTQLHPPRHPHAADAATVFRTDLFVSYGMGVDQYTGQSIIPFGMDRDFGMPYEFRGNIRCMVDGYNGLYAMVNGGQITADWPEVTTSVSRHMIAMPVQGSPTVIMMNNMNGWHTVWSSGQNVDDPTNMAFSNANDTFRLYWGIGDSLKYMDFPTALFNPIQRDPDWEFAEEAYIEYGALDFSTTGMMKIMESVEIRSKEVTSTETLTVEYSADGGPWVSMGTISTQPQLGTTKLKFGANGLFPDNITPRYDGVSADSVRVRVRLARGSNTRSTPILESMSIVFQKLMGKLNGYEFTVDCTRNNGANGKTNKEIQDFLSELIDIGRLIPFYHQGEWKSVRLAGVSGEDDTGTDIKGDRNVALLEVVDA